MRVHLCSYCLKPIRQGQPHHMLRDNETPDRPGDWVPFHSKCVDKLGQMKGAHGQRERNKVHRDVGLGCPVEWHDLWDHASVWTSDDLAQTEMVIRRTQPFNADGVEPYDPGLMMTPVTARDLVTLGYCSGSCLVAADGKDGTSCTCKCKGWWHGHLADTPLHGEKELETKRKSIPTEPDPLVGMWFHSFNTADDGCRLVNGQGRITGRVRDGVYVVEMFDYLMGEGGNLRIATLEEIAGWNLYRTAEDLGFRGLSSAIDSHYGDHVRRQRDREGPSVGPEPAVLT